MRPGRRVEKWLRSVGVAVLGKSSQAKPATSGDGMIPAAGRLATGGS